MITALAGLFAVCFFSATILPGASEAWLVALVLRDYDTMTLWAVAAVANTLGSAVNWFLGRFLLRYQDARWFPFKQDKLERARRWFEARGVWTLVLSWVPIVGDGLTFLAGMMKTPLWLFLILVGIGKAARFAVLIYLLQAALQSA